MPGLAQVMFAGMLVAPAMHALVLDDEGLRREIGAVPDVAAMLREVELGARGRGLAEADVAHAVLAHHLVRHAVLDHLQRRPAGNGLLGQRAAP